MMGRRHARGRILTRRRAEHRGRFIQIALLIAIAALARPAHTRSAPPKKPITRQGTIDRIDRLIQPFFETGSYPSLSVGLVHDDTILYARALGIADRSTNRAARVETIYDIGSVGKVLTTTVLAILHDRGVVRVQDEVARWLPDGAQAPKHPSGGPPMTLEHLATHTSGLPGIPVNVAQFPKWQWRGYSAELLYEGLKQTNLGHPPGVDLAYSSLGSGLLGHTMERATGKPYEQLMEEELFIPLGMTDTVIELSAEQRVRYAVGYETEESEGEAPYWEYGVLAGCGSHRSSVPDLARFLIAQWSTANDKTNPLSPRVRTELHRPRWRSEDGEPVIALGWFITQHPEVGTMLGHRGRTAGHCAFVAFIPERRTGLIALANRGGRQASVELAEFGELCLKEAVSSLKAGR